MVMVEAPEELVSVGGLSARTKTPTSTLKYWERIGAIPASIRVDGDNRRVWKASQIGLIQERIAARRRQIDGPEAA